MSVAAASTSQTPRRHGFVRRILQPLLDAEGTARWLLWIGLAITVLFIVLAVLAPWISPYGFDQFQTAAGARFAKQAAPSAAHPFGTTVQATDVLARVIYGSRTALAVVSLALLFAVSIGVPLGLLSGFSGGIRDRALVLVMDAMFAFPSLLIAIVISFLLVNSIGRGVLAAAIAISVVYTPQYFRVIRNHVLSIREEPYVEAARALGAKPRTIIRRYIVSNVIQTVPVVATLNAADAILTLAGLGFLGYGIEPTQAAEWGYDLQRAIGDAGAGIWWTGLFPGLAVVLLVSGVTLLGEGLNETLNPVLRRRRLTRVDLGAADNRAVPIEETARPETATTLRNVRIWYPGRPSPVHAVDNVSLEIQQGEMLGLVGESGCGKSTLARGILGLLPRGAAVDGQIWVAGEDLTAMRQKQLRRIRGPRVGLIFQEPMTRLNPMMRIDEHFRETLRTHEPSLTDAEIRRRSLEALGGMGIPPTRFRQYPHEFSGGMRQRIMIALALVLEPKLIIADEPTTALDVIVEAQILSIFVELKRNFDTALLLITHNLGIVAESCDRVAVMYAGKIVESGTTERVFAAPAHPYTRALLGSTISLRTRRLEHIPGAPPNLANPPSGCRFHPRCPEAMAVCVTEQPMVESLAPEHRVWCWLHGPVASIPAGAEVALAPRAQTHTEEA